MGNECCGMFVGGHSDKHCPIPRLQDAVRKQNDQSDEYARSLSLAIHALQFYANPLLYKDGGTESIKEDLGARARSTLKKLGVLNLGHE